VTAATKADCTRCDDCVIFVCAGTLKVANRRIIGGQSEKRLVVGMNLAGLGSDARRCDRAEPVISAFALIGCVLQIAQPQYGRATRVELLESNSRTEPPSVHGGVMSQHARRVGSMSHA